jgi:molybdenum cofactor cytidylyltransferase
MNAVCAVLAAGVSRRLGVPRQLLELSDGLSLVRHAALSAARSQAARSAVVVGAHAREVIQAIQGLLVEVIESEDAAEGMAASIRAATVWASDLSAEALLLCACDQPLLSTSHLDALLDRWQRHRGLVASHYGGQRAVPAVFPASYYSELLALSGDSGAAAILRSSPRITLVDWPEGELDIDAAGDLLSFRRPRSWRPSA